MASVADRSTLFTSPVSFADFLFRLAFFSVAPFGIIAAAELFPVRGALIDVALALLVFIAGEAARKLAARSRTVKFVISEALAFEGFYRTKPPRPFAYYFFYPLLFPYWLSNREARREFLVFRSYTIGTFAVLLLSLAYQYVAYWAPELSLKTFLPYVLLTLAVETFLVLSLLMPIATTVVWYHSSYRRGRLAVVLAAGLLSTSIVLAHVASRKNPIVSYATRARLVLRTDANPKKAHRTLVSAARAAFHETAKLRSIPGGQVPDTVTDLVREKLSSFYKRDEAAAFSIWASPLRETGVTLVRFEGRGRARPIWVAVGPDGEEIKKRKDLPTVARTALRGDATEDDSLPVWPEDVDLAVP
ncbi:MAG TPA: hypothetical protein VHE30_20225 [Polyangiaceae bacterium]|nr:hypothetical protein [Polyangiaceae bacterium]